MLTKSNMERKPRLGGSLAHKLTLGYLCAGLIAAITVCLGAYWVAAEIVEKNLRDKLALESLGQKHGLELYFAGVETDLAFLSQAAMSRNGAAAFEKSWTAETRETLHAAYIDENPHPLGSKHLLTVAERDGAYHQAHADFHPSFRAFLEARGYYDIFLISQTGDIVYSVF